MGQTCSKKREANKCHQTQPSKVVLGDSHQNIHTNPTLYHPQQALKQFKQLSMLLSLVGSLDQLKQKTREQFRQLFAQKQLLNNHLKHHKKRIKNKGLIRPPQQDDEALLLQDKKFNKSLQTQLIIAAEIIRTLQQDQDFQDMFPTMCISFMELADSIQSDNQ